MAQSAVSDALPSSANVTCTFDSRIVATLLTSDYEALEYPVAGYTASEITLLDVARRSDKGTSDAIALWVIAGLFIVGTVLSLVKAWRAIGTVPCVRS